MPLGPFGLLEPPTLVKTEGLERAPGLLEPPTLVKTGWLERRPGLLEPPTLVKTEKLERAPGLLEPPTPEKTEGLERAPGLLECVRGRLEPPAPVKTGALEPYPVWGFKNLKGGGVGRTRLSGQLVGALSSVVAKTCLLTVCGHVVHSSRTPLLRSNCFYM